MWHVLLAVLLATGFLMADDDTEQPEDAQPLTASAASVVDAWGDERFQDIDDPATQEASTGYLAAGVGPVVAASLTSGLVNNDFAQGPPNPSLPIGDENPLPGWTWTVVQGAITAYWADDALAPSGHVLRFVLPNASIASDQSYIEQIIPVAAREGFKFVRATWDFGEDSRFIPLPSDARYLRVRVTGNGASDGAGFDLQALTADGSTTGSAIGGEVGGFAGVGADLWSVWAGVPQPAYVTLLGSDITMPATGQASITLQAGSVSASAARFVAPGDGWVVSVSAKSSANVTGADIYFAVYSDTAGAIVGPEAQMGTGVDTADMVATYDSSTNAFVAGDVLRLRANVPTGTLTSTTNDVVVVAVLAFMIQP